MHPTWASYSMRLQSLPDDDKHWAALGFFHPLHPATRNFTRNPDGFPTQYCCYICGHQQAHNPRCPLNKAQPTRNAGTLKCKLCLHNDANCCFMPCNHRVACVVCAAAYNQCFVCRSINYSIFTVFS